MTKPIDDAAPRTSCQIARLSLVALVLVIWGAYVLMTRSQGEPVTMDIIAGGPTAAVLLARQLLPPNPRRVGGAS